MCKGTQTDPDKVVSTSYGPLVRLSDVCNTLRMWAHAKATVLPTDNEYTKQDREQFSEWFDTIELAIRKSNLLGRLFFTADNLRNIPCPTHNGKWAGIPMTTICRCQAFGNLT